MKKLYRDPRLYLTLPSVKLSKFCVISLRDAFGFFFI